MKLLAVHVLLVLGLMGPSFSMADLPVRADIVFRNVRVENLYPQHVIFHVEVCGLSSFSHVLFNYMMYPSGTWMEETRTLEDGQTPDGCYKQKYFLETGKLYMPPFSRITYFWSVREGINVISQNFEYEYTYKNGDYTWKNLGDKHLVIRWHDRPDSFGQNVMSVATLAFNDQAKFYSFSLEQPITIVITNTSDEFFVWQPEEDGRSGMAFPELFLTIQLVEESADYSDWLNHIIPHEISHIYFNHLVKKDSGASRWLDEGLATYNEYADQRNKWIILKTAHEAGKTLSLKDLEDDFGRDPEKIELAYAESYYAVLYMDEVYSKAAITTLLNEYSKGTSAAVAFDKSFGKDPDSFESDFIVWLAERLKTPPPDVYPPQFVSKDTDAEVYFMAVVCCLGGLFVIVAGTIFIVICWRLIASASKR